MRDGDGRKNDQKILMTARQILKKKGGKDAADLFDIVNDPKLAKEAMAALRKGVAENVDPTEALAYVMNQSLSRSRYLAEKKMDKKHKGKNLPYWGKVLVRNLLLLLLRLFVFLFCKVVNITLWTLIKGREKAGIS